MVRSKGETDSEKAMSRVIYFRLGQRDRITFVALLDAFRNVRGVLADLDATVSRDPRGTLRWEVAVLQKNSPPLLGLVAEPIKRRPASTVPIPDYSVRVESELLDNVSLLSHSPQRSDVLSDAALEKMRRLATRSKSLGEIQVSIDSRNASINERTLENIEELTGKKHQSVGSILGNLDAISVHRANEIRVWDENTSRPVRCIYPNELEETVKACLRERVLVSGTVSYNGFGQAISVDVANINRYARLDELPTIEEASGLLDHPTGGSGIKKYLERLRDE